MRIGSLFAGIGGFDLAARWMGWTTAWFSEIEPYASAVLATHWPGVPNHGDITRLSGKDLEPVDLLCGGFPCQDISLAGKGAGIDGARSGLWSHYARLIEEIRPRWVVAENVSALRSRGLDRVLGSLAALGYDAEWHCVPAAAVGAPHRRDRIWIVAYPHTIGQRVPHDRRGEVVGTSSPLQGEAPERQRLRFDAGQLRDAVADTKWSPILYAASAGPHAPALIGIRGGEKGTRTRDGEPQRSDWWATEPDVGRVAHGVPARVDRLTCLGNAIVPLCAFLFFQAIAAAEANPLAEAA